MSSRFKDRLANATFAPPNCDGSFEPDFAAYLKELGATRPTVVLAFAPKAAGTFLRSACVTAVRGAFVRTVHAQGGRDASFYLPTFLLYYAGGFPSQPLVTHVHMQALPANRHFMDTLGLKPAIMVRAIPDMLASYADMLDQNPANPDNWLNFRLPPHYAELSAEAKGDFLIDMAGPWFVSYFATWMEYAAEAPERVLVLDYEGFTADPATTVEKVLAHSGLAQPRDVCQAALDAVWKQRGEFRFNEGVSGRGRKRFTPEQIARLERRMEFYPNLACLKNKLIPPSVS